MPTLPLPGILLTPSNVQSPHAHWEQKPCQQRICYHPLRHQFSAVCCPLSFREACIWHFLSPSKKVSKGSGEIRAGGGSGRCELGMRNVPTNSQPQSLGTSWVSPKKGSGPQRGDWSPESYPRSTWQGNVWGRKGGFKFYSYH